MVLWNLLLSLTCVLSGLQTSQRTSFSQSINSKLQSPKSLVVGDLVLTLSQKLLLDIKSPSGSLLQGYLGWPPPKHPVKYKECSSDNAQDQNKICIQYSSGNRLSILVNESEYSSTKCYNIRWEGLPPSFKDCYILGEQQWFGGGEIFRQRWPLKNSSLPMSAFITGDFFHHRYGGLIEYLWVTSGGFAIFINYTSPLHFSFNESGSENICFATSCGSYPYNNYKFCSANLSYTICAAQNIKEVYKYVVTKWLKQPDDIPDENMFKYPIWSTWAKYKKDINAAKVLQFANEIKNREFPASQIEIDDDWETCYGDLDFNNKFEDPTAMIESLKSMNFRVTLWVHPFCNTECPSFKQGEKYGFWVKNSFGNTSLVSWWNGNAAGYLDVTNYAAKEWFVERLRNLQKKYGVDSFKFDAGELTWLSNDFVFNDSSVQHEPNLYSLFYSEMASRLGNMVEVRIGYRSHHIPVFVRMLDKLSSWTYDNGLKTLIPTALMFAISGYPFILPDMIGGNNYNSSGLPSRELYIRWLQATVFMPSMQFSICPWDYDENVTSIARTLLKLHIKYSELMISLAEESTKTGYPIIRPLWWLFHEDPVAMSIESQFMLGDSVLVAPVLVKGAKSRNIYIPEGKWLDKLRGKSLSGPQWLYNYKAKLNDLPYFLKM